MEEEEEDELSIEGNDDMEYEKDAMIPDTSIGGVEDTKSIERDGTTIRIVDVDDGDAEYAISSRTYNDVDVCQNYPCTVRGCGEVAKRCKTYCSCTPGKWICKYCHGAHVVAEIERIGH